MALTPLEPIPDLDDSTIFTANTPPETVVADLDDLDPFSDAKTISSSVPWPDSTFIIRSVSSGDVLTLCDGRIVLARPGGPGSIHWACVETKGWLGFRNTVSGKFLGHDSKGKLWCSVDRHQGWENFCVRMTPEGGYKLLMTHWERLWGIEKLAKLEDRSDGIVWEFVKV
ncbi:hypothetical protein LSUE1_G003040 [Lachnellula suecica]|uniref:Uncharacterized protein n=1 Tax=Lachnellula suecica TaxID=602035 RepID=A0A8T9CCT9_9HELO|nr:hypothetical protein LSUE1_G003040 [Lachnellula suecica]